MPKASPLVGCAPRIENESQRLALLHSLDLLDTPAEPSFDAITRLAAQITGRPIALIGLVDADRTWFKSRVGLDAPQSPRDVSFCSFAIAGSGLFQVEDSHADPRFADNPLVTGEPRVRFYGGVPLRVGGLPVGTLCVVDHDPYRLTEAERAGLSDLARLTTELLEHRLASHAKSEFIGHMNHEMRTPMNAILGFSQLVQSELAPESSAARQVQHIADAGHHLLELIDESLDLLRLEAGASRIEVADIDLLPLLSSVGQLIGPMARGRHVQLKWQLPAALRARGNARRVKQIVLNLASNAIKYSKPGSEVALSAGDSGDDAAPWVAVADRGPGLTPAQIDKLFKPFERLGQERSGTPGSGLGLALSNRLTEAMGGRIDVESEPGRGSVFTLRLPPPANAAA